MNILLNIMAVRAGGGMQVAGNLLNVITSSNTPHQWSVLLSENSELDKNRIQSEKVTYYSVKNKFHKRYIYEKWEVPKIINQNDIDIILSFGMGLCVKNIPTVTRTTYSNLYFPEINFWKEYSFLKRIYLKIKDKFRLQRTICSTALIFENRSMLNRAIDNFGYNKKNTFFSSPSVSNYLLSSNKYEKKKSHDFNILMLTSYHKNKNIEIIPDVLNQLFNVLNIRNVIFNVTISDQIYEAKKILERAKMLKVEDGLKFVGPVPINQVHEAYNDNDAVILLSLLECFSSNIIESWYFEKPLIISNEEWSRSICNDAVLYVDRKDPQQIASVISTLMSDEKMKKMVVQNGLKMLEDFDSPEQKVEGIINFLKQVFNEYNSVQ